MKWTLQAAPNAFPAGKRYAAMRADVYQRMHRPLGAKQHDALPRYLHGAEGAITQLVEKYNKNISTTPCALC